MNKFKSLTMKIATILIVTSALTACSKSVNEAFNDTKILGTYRGHLVTFQYDDSGEMGKGFYVFRNGDNYEFLASMSQIYSNGKSTTHYTVGAIKKMTENDSLEQLLKVKKDLQRELNNVDYKISKFRESHNINEQNLKITTTP